MQRRRLGLTTLAVVALVACSSDGDGGDDLRSDRAPVIPSVTVPPERLTPFCEAMIDLADRLERDPPDDVAAEILDSYLQIVDEVPPEIEAEFLAVVAELQGTAPPAESLPTVPGATTAPDENFDAEGRLPGDDPSERVNDYVLFTCRDSDNNPGPPPTQPLDDIELDDDTGDADDDPG